MSALGKVFVLFGLVMVAVGGLLMFFEKIPYLGKLPGDIHIKKDNLEFYLPLATSLLISLVLSWAFWLMSYFDKRQ